MAPMTYASILTRIRKERSGWSNRKRFIQEKYLPQSRVLARWPPSVWRLKEPFCGTSGSWHMDKPRKHKAPDLQG